MESCWHLEPRVERIWFVAVLVWTVSWEYRCGGKTSFCAPLDH
jgi:hypothetical protein